MPDRPSSITDHGTEGRMPGPSGGIALVSLAVGTGVAATLWCLALFDYRIVQTRWTWLIIITVMASWPAYAVWRYCARLAIRVDRLEDSRWRQGYVDGYIEAKQGKSGGPDAPRLHSIR